MPVKFTPIQVFNQKGLSGITVIPVPSIDEVTAVEFLITISNVQGSPTAVGVKLSSGFIGGGTSVNTNITSGGQEIYQDIGMLWYFSGNGTKFCRYEGACQLLRITATPIAGLTSFDLQILARVY